MYISLCNHWYLLRWTWVHADVSASSSSPLHILTTFPHLSIIVGNLAPTTAGICVSVQFHYACTVVSEWLTHNPMENDIPTRGHSFYAEDSDSTHFQGGQRHVPHPLRRSSFLANTLLKMQIFLLSYCLILSFPAWFFLLNFSLLDCRKYLLNDGIK